MDDQELYNEIIWVIKNYGSNAGERQNPGSKLESQARRIVDFVVQRDRAQTMLRLNGIELVRVCGYHS